MLTLTDIRKEYVTGAERVEALKGVSISFRKSEFVSVLGPSGCGKTTLLNIIGGLDRYTSGDIRLSGRSTKKFRDRDWDSYRNNTIGFVFQSYNLIPHQTVLANVEMALTLAGVSQKERRRRAENVLEKVGLSDQMHKKPAQMSGGQMQRVAIARALINDPEILLADEPTGALDSDTGIQVMELLKEIASDRLVIMVTHNPELAEKYSTRIVRLLDGRVVDDTAPFESDDDSSDTLKLKRTSMSLKTALGLSLKNLLTKKTRTLLISVAGSIGIIGIALILAMSTGVQQYIDRVERETLASYPLQLTSETMDMSGLIDTLSGNMESAPVHEEGYIYSGQMMTRLVSSFVGKVQENDLAGFKRRIDADDTFKSYISGVSYTYDAQIHIWSLMGEKPLQVNPSTVMESMTSGIDDMSSMGMMGAGAQASFSNMNAMSSMSSSYSTDVFTELLDNKELLADQYDVLAGRWPNSMDEMVLIVTENNTISDYALYSLGLKEQSELSGLFMGLMTGHQIETKGESYSYDELLNLRFRMVLPTDYYVYNIARGNWKDMREEPDALAGIIENGMEISIVGIVRPAEGSIVGSTSGKVGYLSELTRYVVTGVNESEIVKQQLANPDTDVISGMPFGDVDFDVDYIDLGGYTDVLNMVEKLVGKDRLNEIVGSVATLDSGTTYDENMAAFGVCDLNVPSSINIYPKNFEAKEKIKEYIDNYNAENGEDSRISYTDYVALLLSGVTDIIDAITYVLVAFVSISLIVSSIMIGVITYISVLERTKEIGILRALGASKRDISRVFNAETLIVGFTAGALGVIISQLILLPINAVIETLSGISGMAVLSWESSLALIAISMVLTLIAGLIPSRFASRRDPVAALRSE